MNKYKLSSIECTVCVCCVCKFKSFVTQWVVNVSVYVSYIEISSKIFVSLYLDLSIAQFYWLEPNQFTQWKNLMWSSAAISFLISWSVVNKFREEEKGRRNKSIRSTESNQFQFIFILYFVLAGPVIPTIVFALIQLIIIGNFILFVFLCVYWHSFLRSPSLFAYAFNKPTIAYLLCIFCSAANHICVMLSAAGRLFMQSARPRL